MSTQIAVRLPDALVEFLDAEVASGRAASRASVVTSAVEREMRRRLYEREAEILRTAAPDAELDAFTDWAAARTPPPGD